MHSSSSESSGEEKNGGGGGEVGGHDAKATHTLTELTGYKLWIQTAKAAAVVLNGPGGLASAAKIIARQRDP